MFTQVYNCSWVGVHTCTNETHSLAPLQDLIPTFNWQPAFKAKHYAAKVGIKSCRGARECFICACMNAYPAAIVYLSKHMQYAGW